MRVLIWPASQDDGCAQYRLLLPAQAIGADGTTDLELVIDSVGPTVLWDRKWEGHPGDARVLGVRKPDCDVIVMQRPGRRYWAEMIPMLQAHGVRIVVDVDDNFDAIAANHISHRYYEPTVSQAHNRSWIREACKRADQVTVTTPALLEHYGFGHGRVLPNLIPASYLDIRPAETLMAVGWSGHVGTHPNDLQVTGGMMQRVFDDCPGWGFHVIGTGNGVQEGLGLKPDVPFSTTGGWVPFDEYAAAVAVLAVGVVPLDDSLFNAGKSGLKLLELSSVGVPTVASPTPDNRRVHQLGMGELARNPADWLRRVRALIKSPLYTADLAGRSREAAATQTFEQHMSRWVEAWTGKR